jgi:hypothetical protein
LLVEFAQISIIEPETMETGRKMSIATAWRAAAAAVFVRALADR